MPLYYTDFLLPGIFWLLIGLVIVLILVLLWRFLFSKNTTKTPIETQSLFNTEKNFAHRLKTLLQNSGADLATLVPELEEILLSADVGITVTEDLIKAVVGNTQLKTHTDRIAALKFEMAKRLEPKAPFVIDTTQKPFVIYLVGVNGVGKTTTIGKLAKQFKDQGLKVMLVAADTFRAAAVEQLRVWSERNAVAFSGGLDGMDPSAAIVDGLQAAVAQKVDVVLVDTAGRLHTKTNLMSELQKMVRMSEKVLQKKPDEILLVVDAITGQNGFAQAKIFWEAIPLTGVVLTKYDATSKGGIILAITAQTGLPVRFVGLGEGVTDLKAFDSHSFIEKIFSNV